MSCNPNKNKYLCSSTIEKNIKIWVEELASSTITKNKPNTKFPKPNKKYL